jgi:hypothetical protein
MDLANREKEESVVRVREERMRRERMARVAQEVEGEERMLSELRRERELQKFSDLERKVAYLKTITESPHLPPKPRSSHSPIKRSPLKRDYANLTNLSRLTQV